MAAAPVAIRRRAARRPGLAHGRCGAAWTGEYPARPSGRERRTRHRVFDRAAAAAGLRGLTPHELRHTAASLAVAAGANVKAVQRMLGHLSAAMTLDVYAGLFGDDLDELADGLDRLRRAGI